MNRKLLDILTILLIAASCSPAKPDEGGGDDPIVGEMDITAVIADAVKTGYVIDDKTGQIKTSWAVKDKIDLFKAGGDGKPVTYTLKSGAGTATAVFTGDKLEKGENYYAVYPSGAGRDRDAWTEYLGTQEYAVVSEREIRPQILSVYDIMKGEENAGKYTFTRQTALMKVNMGIPASHGGFNISHVTVSGAWGDKSLKMTFPGDECTGSLAVNMIVPEGNVADGAKLTVETKIGDSVFKGSCTPGAVELKPGAQYSFDFNNDTYPNFINGHEYIDLGILKSDLVAGIAAGSEEDRRIVFAATNIGADSDEEFGYYFRWGELMGWQHNMPAAYGDNTLISAAQKDRDGNTITSEFDFKTWILNGVKGLESFEGRTDLQYIDPYGRVNIYGDAAAYNWGGEWHMMDAEIIRGLAAATSIFEKFPFETTIGLSRLYFKLTGKTYAHPQYDAFGLSITNKDTGASLFIRFSGMIKEDKLLSAGTCGYFWSSTAVNDAAKAFSPNLMIYNNLFYREDNDRSVAMPIRPIAELPLR